MGLLEKLAAAKLPIVVGEGPKRARLLLLGEALGKNEVELLRPFMGDAGWLLNDVLRCAGVPRGECYVMNVVPTRPPNNDIERLSELGISLVECTEWCRGRIAELRPLVVLAMGDVPLQALTGRVGITNWRGSILSTDVPGGIRVTVVPTFHPSYVKRMADKSAKKERESQGSIKYTYGSARLSMVMDTKRAWEEATGPPKESLFRELIVSPSKEQVARYVQQALDSVYCSFDVETMGKWIDCVGLSTRPTSAICIPRGKEYWGIEAAAIDALLGKVLWNHTGLVAQNASFDVTMLMGNGLPVQRVAIDTQVAHHWMHPELPHDLHYLTSIYTREPYYKWMLRAAIRKEDRWIYNCLDAATTLEAAEALVLELVEFGVEREFFGYVMPLFHAVLKMGLRGVRVDQVYQDRLRRLLTYLIERRRISAVKVLGLQGKSQLEVLYPAVATELLEGGTLSAEWTKAKLRRLQKEPVNLSSPNQLKKLFYEVWGLPKQYQRKRRTLSVDEEALRKLMKVKGTEQCPKPVVLKTILDVRDAQKRKSNYADVEPSFDGRLRTLYSVTGTETGRLNSKGDYFGQGWNSQNAPKWFRKIVIPTEGSVLIEADLKFAEALLIAWFARDEATIRAVRAGADIYRWHGSRMFGKPPEAITKEERTLIKPVILGCGYGLGPNHLAEMLGVSVAEGKRLRALFFESCPAILSYQEKIQEQLKHNRTLVTPFNRRRVFLGRLYKKLASGKVVLNEDMCRKGYAFLPQSTCAEYLNRAMVRVDLRLPEGAEVLLQVHDAMVLEVRRGMERSIIDLIVCELAVPVIIQGEPLVIPVEIKISTKSWGELEEVGVFNGFGAAREEEIDQAEAMDHLSEVLEA